MLQPHLLSEMPHSKDCVHGRECRVCGIQGLKGEIQRQPPSYVTSFNGHQQGKLRDFCLQE